MPQGLTRVIGTIAAVAAASAHGAAIGAGYVAGPLEVVADINPTSGSSPRLLTPAGGGQLFFNALDQDGLGLWRTDGTAAGTRRLIDPAVEAPTQITAVGSSVFFDAADADTNRELWASDGTADGTRLVRDINPESFARASTPSSLTELDGALYFGATNGSSGRELWRSDGTEAGTQMVVNLRGAFSSVLSQAPMIAFDGAVYYRGDATVSAGNDLYRSDGTSVGTSRVTNINVAGDPNGNAWPDSFAAAADTLFFTANDGVHGYELWKTDGTAGGTTLVKDIRPGPDNSYFTLGDPFVATIDDTVYFRADDGVHGMELWRSDGTDEGTRMVADLDVGSGSSLQLFDNPIVATGDRLFWAADDGVTGNQLWTLSHGDETPTRVDGFGVPEGVLWNVFPRRMSAFGGRVYLRATGWQDQTTVWVSDGTAEGTAPFTLEGGTRITSVGEIVAGPDRVYVSGRASFPDDVGFELYSAPLVSLANPLPGDYDRNGLVDADDYAAWVDAFGGTTGLALLADGNGDGVVNAADYSVWRDAAAASIAIPEPAGLLVAVALMLAATAARW